jgi:hypothetical protein
VALNGGAPDGKARQRERTPQKEFSSLSGAVVDTHPNTATGFLTVLKDQHVIAGQTHA